MQGEAGEIESGTSTSEGKYQNLPVEAAIWLVRFAAVVYLISLTSVLWNDDEVRLHMLHLLMRIFQTLARTFGLWALQLENAYNDYVSILH